MGAVVLAGDTFALDAVRVAAVDGALGLALDLVADGATTAAAGGADAAEVLVEVLDDLAAGLGAVVDVVDGLVEEGPDD